MQSHEQHKREHAPAQAQSPFQALFQPLEEIESEMSAALRRFDCPASDTLQQFYWGQLNHQATVALHMHLGLCPACRQELADLAAFVGPLDAIYEDAQLLAPRYAASRYESPVSDSIQAAEQAYTEQAPSIGRRLHQAVNKISRELTQRGEILIAQFISGFTPAPAFALRGEEESSFLYEVNGALISLMMQPGVASPIETPTVDLQGQILAESGEGVIYQFQLIPQEPEGVIQSGVIGSDGNFTLHTLLPGRYQLILRNQQQTIVIPTMQVPAMRI
jgi:hypothetical protein